MKFVILAQPPNPKPTTKTQITMNAFTAYTAVQLGRKKGGFSAAFCSHKNYQIIKRKLIYLHNDDFV